MVATQQQTLDLWRAERGIEQMNDAMQDKRVPPVQRAVVILLAYHERLQRRDDCRALTISLRAAADWICDRLPHIAGTSVDHTSVRKALQAWIDRGVVQSTGSAMARTLWLSVARLREWHDAQPDTDEAPLFGQVSTSQPEADEVPLFGQVLTGVDSVLTTVDRWGPVLTAGDSQEEEKEEDVSFSEEKTNTSFSSSSSNEGQQRSTAVNTEPRKSPPADPSRAVAILRSAPPLPDEVWDKRPDESILKLLIEWWRVNGLTDTCGPLKDFTTELLCGLVLRSRAKDRPQAFFATCLHRGVLPVVVDEGRAWLKRTKAKCSRPAAPLKPQEVAHA